MSEASGGRVVHIVGAGPAGIAAALTVAQAGSQAIIHEQRPDVGSRFHGDLQAVENWTTNADALEELAACRHAERVAAARLSDAGGRQGRVHARAVVLRIQVGLEVSAVARGEHQLKVNRSVV